MMTNDLLEWQRKHGITAEALADLVTMVGLDVPRSTKDTPEARVQDAIRLCASKNGAILWRNTVGALKDENGRLIRYGLCNDTKKLNENIKSSDLIGITPVMITDEMVGSLVGVFTAVEVKKSDWKFLQSDKRACAQLKFGQIVIAKGGIFTFANSEEQYEKAITGKRKTK